MATANTLQEGTAVSSKPKRTRVLSQQQSRSGCFTCKARRIKCDETFPTCLRCSRSGKTCEGYSQKVVDAIACRPKSESVTPPSQHTSIWLSVSDALPITNAQGRLAKLGMGLLNTDSIDCFGTSGAVLEYMLPQMAYSIPSVNAAAAALGSAYLMQIPQGAQVDQDPGVLVSHYIQALKAMQKDLLDRPHGVVPLILACLLLAIAEVILKKEDNALVHMRGAFQLLTQRRIAQAKTTPSATASVHERQDDELETLFRGLDLQTAAYALGFQPDLPLSPEPIRSTRFTDLASARQVLIQILHTTFAWSSASYPLRYHPWRITTEILLEQGRQISHLSMFLEKLDHELLPNLAPGTAGHALALVMRSECIGTLIHASTAFNGREISFDIHAPRFRQIVRDAQVVANFRNRNSLPDLLSDTPTLPKFSTGPGLAQVLFFVARRYRDPEWRRKAIVLLSQLDREGPWYGLREAATGMRCIQHEEAWPDSPPPVSNLAEALKWSPKHGRPQTLSDVSEAARLAGVVFSHELYPLGDDRTRASYGRCRDIELLLNCRDCEYVSMNGFIARMSPLDDEHSPTMVQARHGHWDIWEEEIPYGRFAPVSSAAPHTPIMTPKFREYSGWLENTTP